MTKISNLRADNLDNEIEILLHRLPSYIQNNSTKGNAILLEVVLDLGRNPELRFSDDTITLEDIEVSQEDIAFVTKQIGLFGADNRAGIERTLHRISALRNRSGVIIGLTCRIGRAIEGTAKLIEDIVREGRSVLLVGRPGVGKTTMLREVARMLANDASRRTVIVDTSNEIAGDGDIPHPAIGRSRRLQVPTPAMQHSVMIEAVENHMPQVIVIDEMGTEQEAIAARTIAERGVQLIATAHGNTLENLIANPTLSDLVGGVKAVTLGDDEARRRATQKTVLERQSPPTFDVLVEIQSWEKVNIHLDVATTVDKILRGYETQPETRSINPDGIVVSAKNDQRQNNDKKTPQAISKFGDTKKSLGTDSFFNTTQKTTNKNVQIFPFGVDSQRLTEVALRLGFSVGIADEPRKSEFVLTTKAHYRRRPNALLSAEKLSIPVHVLRRNTVEQISYFFSLWAARANDVNEIGGVLELAELEAQKGISSISDGLKGDVELSPQSSFVRKMQHRIVERSNLKSYSVGRGQSRRVTIHRE